VVNLSSYLIYFLSQNIKTKRKNRTTVKERTKIRYKKQGKGKEIRKKERKKERSN
jgi:hypothetical protein